MTEVRHTIPECDKRTALILAALHSGLSVRIKVTGFSMSPSILPDSWIIVRPLRKSEIPAVGAVVLVRTDGFAHADTHFIAHRVLTATADYVTTQGDSNLVPDPTSPASDILGIVTCRFINGRGCAMHNTLWRRWMVRHPKASHRVNNIIARVMRRLAPRRKEVEG